jgi:hypothetical protein
MLTCQIELRHPWACAITVRLADANKLRWTVAAVRSHARLRDSLINSAQGGATQIIDNVSLLELAPPARQQAVPLGTHVVLWDGYNSLLELHAIQPELTQRQDVVYLCVGMVPEVAQAMPVGTLPLYDPDPATASGMASSQNVRLPWGYDLQRRLRSQLRLLRNWQISRDRHRQLSEGGRIVFCGLVRPSEHVLNGFLRGTQIAPSWVQRSGLVNLEWRGRSAAVRQVIESACTQLIDELRALPAPAPADWAGVYTLMNVMHRIGTLSLISEATEALFVNEFTLNQHLDPYDAAGYGRNLFLDFGSVRGPEALYPRTVDIALNAKPSLALRWLPDGERMSRCRAPDTPSWLWRRCQDDAQRSAVALQALA